jgi:molybdopterin-containing oxidoreductase family iron-sulfur binding subunit
MSENKENTNSRREFLKIGSLVGVGVAAAGAAAFAGYAAEEGKGGHGGEAQAALSESEQKIRVLTQDGRLAEIKASELTPAAKEEYTDALQHQGREGIPGKHWVMVIDLSRCRNTRACMAACQNAHHLREEQHHINVLRMQDDRRTEPYFMPKPCFHCDNPPCTKVCPVDATFKRQDGIVLIDNERCIGCRFCIAACPYSARVFNWFEPKEVEGDDDLLYDVELNVPQKKGTVSKCLFSADRLREGKLPYCVSACPNGVYYFGDINEDSVTNGTSGETVRFSELVRKNAGYTLLPELGTKPNVYYLPPKNRMFPFKYNGKTTLEDEHHG